jgi:tetratricopeptide (TPR) repeat protein
MSHLAHARILRDRRRHDEAVTYLHSHLAQHPEDPEAFIELALNRSEIDGQLGRALEDAKHATGLMPGHAFPLALQANLLSRMDREKEALPLAEAAVTHDPDLGFAWQSKCIALCGLSRWNEAEQCAREALKLSPDDIQASNLLSHALRLQNRLDESEAETRRRLARDPENAFSFANAGWAALQRGEGKQAEAHFLEALRLDPELEFARNGLKEAYRARSAFYRVFLQGSFRLQGLQSKYRTLLTIGLVMGFKVLRTIASQTQPVLLLPLFLIYYLFIFGSWLSPDLANLILLRDPIARFALDLREKVQSVVVSSLFLCGLPLAGIGMGSGLHSLTILGATFAATALPATLCFTNPSFLGRLVFRAGGLLVLSLGGLAAWLASRQPDLNPFKSDAGGVLSVTISLTVILTWVSMIPSLKKSRAS